MAVDEKKTGPPQPILIQAGERTEPESVKAELQSAVPKAVEVRKGGGASQEAIDHYRMTLSTKPSVVGMSVLGLLLIVVVPFLLVLSAFESGDDDAAVVCCFSFISGIVLLLVAQTKESAWQKQIKLAKQRVINEAGLKAPPMSKTAHFVFAVFAFLVFLAPTLPFYYSDVISAASIVAAGIAAVFALSQEAEAKKILDRNFKAILEQRGNEQE
jgi:hypothetical protein